MTRVALAASGDLPEWTPAAARPSTFGLLVWDGGLPHLPWRGAPEQGWTTTPLGTRVPPTVPVDGVTWAPDSGGIVLSLLTRTDAVMDGLLVDRWARPALFPFAAIALPLLDPVPVTGADWAAGLVAALGATWLLMMQPGITETRPLREDQQGERGAGPGSGRPDRRDREVSVIDLRRQPQRSEQHEPDPSAPTRRYGKRWIVSPHWRQQAVGPGRTQRRPVYVPAHVKGPEGAPWVEVEHVHVWRR